MKRLHNLDLLLLWFKEYLTINGYRPRTIQSYLHELSLFRRWLFDETTVSDVEELQPAELTGFIASLYKRELAATTIEHKTCVLKSFLSICYRENRIYRNLSEVLSTTRLPRKIPAGLLSESEINHLLDYLKEFVDSAPTMTHAIATLFRDRAMLELLYSSGIRRNELLPLQCSAFDFDNGILYIYNGKGGKDRVVPVGSVALYVLETYLKEARPKLLTATSEEYLFPSKKGGHISRSAFAASVHRLCRLAGISKQVRIHDFRHACATHMLNRGADIRYVQELLGHSSLTSTQVYTHIAVDQLKRTHEQYHPREVWNH